MYKLGSISLHINHFLLTTLVIKLFIFSVILSNFCKFYGDFSIYLYVKEGQVLVIAILLSKESTVVNNFLV